MKHVLMVSAFILVGTIYFHEKSSPSNPTIKSNAVAPHALRLMDLSQDETLALKEIPSLVELEDKFKNLDESQFSEVDASLKTEELIKLANKNRLSPGLRDELTLKIRSRQALNKIVLERKIRELEERHL